MRSVGSTSSKPRHHPMGASTWFRPTAAAPFPAILGAAAGAGAHITSVEITEPDLESVFLHLTGKALRD
jgi:ABC-2 type transport system ATP-binding protein